MSKYGIPYKGNKSKIADEILNQLPNGNRLVDLFGGGFAITHCALVNFPDKWNKFFYNDINPLLQPLIMDAINGKYLYKNFTPQWISREDFYNLKEVDGYIKWIWSFGNNGNDYLYGKNVEEDKRKMHEFIVNNVQDDIFNEIVLSNGDIQTRRLEFQKQAKNLSSSSNRLQHLEQLESLSRLEGLSRLNDLSKLESLSKLEKLSNLDYRKYKYQEGDVVYCDIPYEDAINPKDYGGGFNHKDFYQWAKAQPFNVYYSSYTKGSVIWQKQVRTVMNSADGGTYRNEVLFAI